jgi:P-type Mg2+ transporter
MTATKKLHDLGQSLWLDNVIRDLLTSGTLKRYIEQLSATGLTSNPSIFDQAIAHSNAYDADWLTKPRKWTIGEIQRFILFIGPISSISDYLTFFIMLYVLNCWNNRALFHTGWFVESLFTQTLIIHVIRTHKVPFLQSRASWPLIASSLIIVSVGAWLTVSPLAGTLGFVPLPPLYWLLPAIMLPFYVILTQLVKT